MQIQGTSPQSPQAAATAEPPAPSEEQNLPQAESDEKIFAVIGYLAFLFVVPLIAKPKSKFCQLHAKQSMVMFLITILVLVVLAAIPLIGSLLTLALFALYILAIYRSYRGDYWKIPVVSAFSEKIDLAALYGKTGLSIEQIGGLKEKMGELAGKVGEGVKKIGEQEAEKPSQPVQTEKPDQQKQ